MILKRDTFFFVLNEAIKKRSQLKSATGTKLLNQYVILHFYIR